MLELNKIYNMDCLEGMKLIHDNIIDLIVTSPPYNIGEGGSTFKFKGYDIYNDNNSDMAKQLGRKYIGFELSEEYCKIAEQRL